MVQLCISFLNSFDWYTVKRSLLLLYAITETCLPTLTPNRDENRGGGKSSNQWGKTSLSNA